MTGWQTDEVCHVHPDASRTRRSGQTYDGLPDCVQNGLRHAGDDLQLRLPGGE